MKIPRNLLHFLIAAAMGLLFLTPSSHASHPGVKCSPIHQSATQYSISQGIPRDAPVGTPLGLWQEKTNFAAFKCSQNDTETVIPGFKFTPSASLKKTSLHTNRNGTPYAVFQTPVPGIGVAVAVGGDCPTRKLKDLGDWDGDAMILNCSREFGTGSHRSFSIVMTTEVVLVKTGVISAGASLSTPLFEVEAMMYKTGTSETASHHSAKFSLKAQGFVAQTCKTQDFRVIMGEHLISEFNRPGARSKPVAFSLPIVECQDGINGIKYSFDGMDDKHILSQGLVTPLTPDSTATGIQLVVTGEKDQSLRFDTQYTASFVKGTKNISIPLKASYLRTNKALRAGTANAILHFTMYYE